MLGNNEVESGAEWSFEGVTTMTWRQWIWFKIKNLLNINPKPTLYK